MSVILSTLVSYKVRSTSKMKHDTTNLIVNEYNTTVHPQPQNQDYPTLSSHDFTTCNTTRVYVEHATTINLLHMYLCSCELYCRSLSYFLTNLPILSIASKKVDLCFCFFLYSLPPSVQKFQSINER